MGCAVSARISGRSIGKPIWTRWKRVYPAARVSTPDGERLTVQGLFLDLNIRYSAGQAIQFGPPKALSPFEAMSVFARSEIAGRSYLPLNITAVAQMITERARQTPTISARFLRTSGSLDAERPGSIMEHFHHPPSWLRCAIRSSAAGRRFAYSRLSLRILISRNAVRQPINTMPNTMSSEAFRINDANNATPTTPKMSSGKMGSRPSVRRMLCECPQRGTSKNTIAKYER